MKDIYINVIMIKNEFSTIKKLNEILTANQKSSLSFLFLLILLSAILETFGISLIIPYFAILTEPDIFLKSKYGNFIVKVFHSVEQTKLLIALTIILILAFGTKYLITYIIKLKQTKFVNANRFAMAKQVMNNLLREDYESYRYRNITEEINLITTHVTWTFELINALLYVMISILIAISLSVFMLVVDIKLTLIFGLGISLLYILFNRIYKEKVKIAGKEADSTWEEYDKIISEAFLLKKENDVFSRNEKVFDDFCYFGNRNVLADEKKLKYSLIPGFIINLISVWAILFFVLFSLVSGNNIIGNLGKLSAFYIAVTRIIPAINSIYSYSQMVTFYSPSLDKVYNLIKTFIKTDFSKTLNYNISKMNESLVISNVSFKYRDSSNYVLKNASFRIKHGESIGIVGKTGIGKTTLVNILIGLLIPTNGEILVDGYRMKNDSILDVGYVPQDTNLLDSTIRENIIFGRAINDDELTQIVKDSGLLEFINQLPQGLDTKIGAQGIRLSGGQKQRIGIARALVGSPTTLIFDEATSSLDLNTEKEIIEIIKSYNHDKTIIMVSHRHTALEFCDRCLSVHDNNVKEYKS